MNMLSHIKRICWRASTFVFGVVKASSPDKQGLILTHAGQADV